MVEEAKTNASTQRRRAFNFIASFFLEKYTNPLAHNRHKLHRKLPTGITIDWRNSEVNHCSMHLNINIRTHTTSSLPRAALHSLVIIISLLVIGRFFLYCYARAER
jgi:hypothetical protein